jgi:hypothetical protein
VLKGYVKGDFHIIVSFTFAFDSPGPNPSNRRLSVSEEILNMSGHYHELNHQKKQMDFLKNRLEDAERVNAEVIAEKDALVEMSQTQEQDISSLKIKLQRTSDYDELRRQNEGQIEKFDSILEENRKLKRYQLENEVLKTRCDNHYRLKETSEEEKRVLLLEKDENYKSLERAFDECEEKNSQLKVALDQLEMANLKIETLAKTLQEFQDCRDNSARMSITSEQNSFTHPMNLSGVPFELEFQNDQLKSEIDRKSNELRDRKSALVDIEIYHDLKGSIQFCTFF